MIITHLSDLAYEREAERLRHMARRARHAAQDHTPIGLDREHYAERLERQALDVLALKHARH